jgi:putative transposase
LREAIKRKDEAMSQRQYQRELDPTQLPTIWTIPEKMWQEIRPLLPPEKEPGTPGRTPVPFRKVINGILFVLRTGCQWKALPKGYGSGSTAHRRFQQWTQAGIIDAIVELMLGWYDRCRGIDWEWQVADTKLLAAPLGGEATGPNPTDRGKSGTKRHLLVDGRGVPLAFHLSGAERHDLKGLSPLLDRERSFAPRPKPSERRPQHLCLDKAYDAEEAEELLEELGYTGHIKRRGQSDEPGVGEVIYPARRWKVERSISWLNNMRKLRVRWEKKAENYRGLWMLAAALITYRRIILG